MKHKQPSLLKILSGSSAAATGSIPTDKKLVFILSTGRTGTTFLANLFGDHKEVFAVHEPKPSWRLRMHTMAYLDGKVDQELLFSVFSKYRQGFIMSRPETIYIESNPFLNGFATAIVKNVPNSHIIHIVRDPRNYITSGINHGALHGKKAVLNRCLPYWQNGHRFLEARSLKSAMIERLAEFWKLANLEIAKVNHYTDNYLCLKFEELFNDETSEQKMIEISKFIGIDKRPIKNSSDKGKNPSKYRDLETWTQWNDKTAKTVNEICSPLMQTYGYGQEPEWRRKVD